MRRKLFSFAAAASALLCGATLLMRAGYSDTHMAVEFRYSGGRWELATDSGRLWLDNAPQVNEERRAQERAEQLMKTADGQRSRAYDDRERARRKYAAASDGTDAEFAATRSRLKAMEAAFLRAETNSSRLAAAFRRASVRPLVENSVPLWVPAVLTAVLPVIWMARDLRRSRTAQLEAKGLCPACGYDLRASPNRCPECGRPRPMSGENPADRVPQPSV